MSKAVDFFIRLMDFTLSLLAIMLLAPLLVFVALLIVAFDGPPALHTHERFGAGGRKFRIIKFRSLTNDYPIINRYYALTEKHMRLNYTRTGRLLRLIHFDELPQLLNVLKGDMSLVGPRPVVCSSDSEDSFEREVMRRRKEVGVSRLRPGLTGFTQLAGSDIPVDELMMLDEEYLKRRGVWLNTNLILKTAGYIILRMITRGKFSFR